MSDWSLWLVPWYQAPYLILNILQDLFEFDAMVMERAMETQKDLVILHHWHDAARLDEHKIGIPKFFFPFRLYRLATYSKIIYF